MDSKQTTLQDLWTTSKEYKTLYQTDAEIEDTLRLLDLPMAKSLVDVGCGNGAFAILAAQQHPECQVWAFDPMESAIEECRRRGGNLLNANLHPAVAWADDLPLQDQSADRVLMRSVLHHIPDAAAAYREMARVLRPGGKLLLQTPCNFWEASFADALRDFHLLMDTTHERQYHQPANIVVDLEVQGILTETLECWPYPFSPNEKQVEFIRQRGLEKRVRLAKTGDDWCIRLFFTRIIAQKECAHGHRA